MKLCRFVLAASPGDQRSGVYHQSKVYETDGVNAIGIHEPTDVRFLSPIGRPPSIRFFEPAQAAPGQWELAYHFLNPASLLGADETLRLPPDIAEAGMEIRIGAVVKDTGACVEEREAESFILGYTFVVCLTDLTRPDRDEAHNWARTRDLGMIAANFVVTPEDLADYLVRESRTQFQFSYSVFVNDEKIDGPTDYVFDSPFADLLTMASFGHGVTAGDFVSWPALPFPSLEETNLGRGLMPGDRLRVVVDGISAATGRIG